MSNLIKVALPMALYKMIMKQLTGRTIPAEQLTGTAHAG